MKTVHDPDLFAKIESAAHDSAFGINPRQIPTDRQLIAGNYKKGRVTFHGLPLVIEQPRGSYRTGLDASGKRWTSRMAAHYGYIAGTKGADGDEVDCFVGPFPHADQAFVINQHVGGRFDEHKVMLGFMTEADARRAYLDSFDRGWPGLKSLVPVSLSQLGWWLKFGNPSQQITPENLPYEGMETMELKRIQWDDAAAGGPAPLGTTLERLLYDIRRSDHGEDLMLDSVTAAEILEGSEGALAFDALVTPFSRLGRKMEILRSVMERTGKTVKPAALQVTEPFKQLGRAMVAAIFELSDGQTVSVYFHNPDTTPSKLAPADELVSWKWLLNKKDITIVAAPERGEDLNVREVARRVMALAEKNSAAFVRANSNRAARMQAIQGLKDEITGLEKELSSARHELEVAMQEKQDREDAAAAVVPEAIDPTGPEGYAAIRGDDGALLKYQDQLDSMFGGRVLAVREALGALGWGYSRSSPWPMSRGAYSVDANFKQVGGGRNVVGVAYVVKEGRDFTAEFGDSLTKTPQELAAQIDEAAGPSAESLKAEEDARLAQQQAEEAAAEAERIAAEARAAEDAKSAEEAARKAAEEAAQAAQQAAEEVAQAARREMDDEITYVKQGTYSADYLRGQRSAGLLAYFEQNPEALAAHEAALAEAVPPKEEMSAGGAEAALASVPTRFVEKAMSVPDGWIAMNAPRPLIGHKTLESGEFVSGRFYAGIDLSDSLAETYIKSNARDGAIVVITATREQIGAMAMEGSKYQEAYMQMDAEERWSAVQGLVKKIQDKPYPEAVAMLSRAKDALSNPDQPKQESPSLSKEERKNIAETILIQLGGAKFKAMTGAKDFLAIGDGGMPGLRFALPSNFAKDGINRVFIRLNASDSYDIEFGKARGTSYKVISMASGIYADALNEAFTSYTGLDTSLGGSGLKQEEEVTPDQPTPAPVEPPEKAADRALFQSVINGTAPDMLAAELADQLEAAYYRHESDPEMAALFEEAVNAYQAAMMAATANL